MLSFGFLSHVGNLHCNLFVVETFCSQSLLYSPLGRTKYKHLRRFISVKTNGTLIFISVFLIILHYN